MGHFFIPKIEFLIVDLTRDKSGLDTVVYRPKFIGPTMSHNRNQFSQLQCGSASLRTISLAAIALFTVHAISSLVFSVLGLAPSSPNWGLTLTLGGFLAVAGAAVGLQTLKILPQRLTGLLSGASSGALLCFYSFGQLSGQAVLWAITGAVVGLVAGGGLGYWSASKPGFWRVAIALVSTLCAYGFAFGLGTWTLAAVKVQHWGLVLGLGGLTFIYLWFTQRALEWTYRQWQLF